MSTAAAALAGVVRIALPEPHVGVAWVSDAHAALNELEQKAVRAEEALMTALVAFYSTDYAECARLCDEVLDRKGALLGRVRALAAVEADTP